MENRSDFEGLCMAVGHVTISWALIEQSLDYCCSIIFTHCGGESIREDLPRMLTRKIDFIKTAVKTLQPLSQFKDDAMKLLERISNDNHFRNDLVHSAAQSIESDNGVFKLHNLDVKQTTIELREIEFDGKKFPTIARVLGDLVTDTQNFSLRLQEHF